MVQRPHRLLEMKWVSTSSAVLLALAITLFTATNGLAQWATSGNDISNTNAGNVGVGNISPSYILDIKGSSVNGTFRAGPDPADPNKGYIYVDTWGTLAALVPTVYPNWLAFGLAGRGDSWGRFGFGLDSGTPWMGFGPGNTSRDAWLYRRNGDFTFEFGTSPAEKMRITSSGKLGIGTNAPATALHVVGDVTVTGNIAAKYQDLAEWVLAARSMPAGTVLVLDTEALNQVRASSQAYDVAVAGVISVTPGILLGEAGEGKVKVATTGRVKVKVDASRTPVRVGDLLVTSNKQGMAMPSEAMDINGRKFHQPGTILGKALESLKEGEGEILVLLSLQ
jgi:hypothetical protein